MWTFPWYLLAALSRTLTPFSLPFTLSCLWLSDVFIRAPWAVCGSGIGSQEQKRAVTLASNSFSPWGAASGHVGDFCKEESTGYGVQLDYCHLLTLFDFGQVPWVLLSASVSFSVIKRSWRHFLSPLCLHFDYVLIFLCFIFWLHHTACRILVPWPGIKPVPPVWSAESSLLDHQRNPLKFFNIFTELCSYYHHKF